MCRRRVDYQKPLRTVLPTIHTVLYSSFIFFPPIKLPCSFFFFFIDAFFTFSGRIRRVTGLRRRENILLKAANNTLIYFCGVTITLSLFTPCKQNPYVLSPKLRFELLFFSALFFLRPSIRDLPTSAYVRYPIRHPILLRAFACKVALTCWPIRVHEKDAG